MPVRAGRAFTPEDRAGTPYVTVINEALAARRRETFGIQNPVGCRCRSADSRLRPGSAQHHDHRRHHRQRTRAERPAPAERSDRHVPIAQAPRQQIKLAIPSRGEAFATLPAVTSSAKRQHRLRLALNTMSNETPPGRHSAGSSNGSRFRQVTARCRLSGT
jgi:hypothetical protein